MHLPKANTVMLDLDDTLIETTCFYQDVRQQAFDFLATVWPKFYLQDAETVLNQIEGVNIQEGGFACERFPRSLGQLFNYYWSTLGIPKGSHDLVTCVSHMQNLGWSIFDVVHPVKEYALDLLASLRSSGYQVIILTRGDTYHQHNKVRQAGFLPYVNWVIATHDKSAGVYQAVLDKLELQAHEVVMIGDSIKADIQPACEVGIAAIHVPISNEWSFEAGFCEYPYHRAADLSQVLSLLVA